MPDLELTTYSAVLTYHGDPAHIECSCSDCSWKGKAESLAEIGDAHLTPGDASPAGRCPECGALAYVDEPVPLGILVACDDAETLRDIGKRLSTPGPMGYDSRLQLARQIGDLLGRSHPSTS